MNQQFDFISVNGLTILTNKEIPLPHGFTTIAGGSSTVKEYRGLNLGVNSNDKNESIMENYRRLCESFQLEITKIAVLNQNHSDSVYCVKNDTLLNGVNRPSHRMDGDGLISNLPGVTLMVFTADCVPVLLYDSVKKVAGAVHSGWRGTVKGIAAKAVKIMQEEYDCNHITCAIGPSIGKCHFETGLEVYAEFKQKFGDSIDRWAELKHGKAYISLQDCIKEDVLKAGAVRAEITDECTVCHNDRYYSHRCGDLGRMAAFITIR